MKSEVKVYSYPNGEIQRVQSVTLEDWAELLFLQPHHDPGALSCFADIYENFLVPAGPWIFPNMVLFQLPGGLSEDVEPREENGVLTDRDLLGETPRDSQAEISLQSKKYGTVWDTLTAVTIALEKGVKIKKGKPVFKTQEAKTIWETLEKQSCIRIVSGKRPGTQIIPIGKCPGYLSKTEPKAKLKVNANFFIMDPFDCATVFDQVGTVLGLCVKDGVVENPPLFNREALLVKKDGTVSVEQIHVNQLEIEINGKKFQHGKNARIYSRPERAKTPKDKTVKLVIVGRKVVAVKNGGSVKIPASGFVMSVDAEELVSQSKDVFPTNMKGENSIDVKKTSTLGIVPGDTVVYQGLNSVQFGIQVGNSIIKDGIKTEKFISDFYNIYHLEPVPYPPSLYPMDFEKARAARIALGSDRDGKPVIFWAEGAGKLGYTLGEDSTGASLMEMADIAEDLGLVNAVNLDGGGSAQILLENQRLLRISDRNKADNSDAERLVPMGLMVL